MTCRDFFDDDEIDAIRRDLVGFWSGARVPVAEFAKRLRLGGAL
jgi:hypothetical protein